MGCPFEVPSTIPRIVLPEIPELLEGLFLVLRKYTALLHHAENSAKLTVRVLNILLTNELFQLHHTVLSELCELHVSMLYPILCRLFHKAREFVQHQSTTVIKVLGEDTLEMVALLRNFIRAIKPNHTPFFLDNIQKDMWFILMMWFFDCTYHITDHRLNNLYQNHLRHLRSAW